MCVGKRVKLNPPNNINVQWAEKCSYRLQHVLEYIKRLPHVPVMFSPEKRNIFPLDDYSAHPKEVESVLKDKVYFLIAIGGGITGDMQVNDTTYHRVVKAAYRKREMKLMIDLFKEHPDKIPASNRDQMKLFEESWKEVCEHNVNAFKQNMLTLTFDGSEDHLASRKLVDLVSWHGDA